MTPTQSSQSFHQSTRTGFRTRARIARAVIVLPTLASIATVGLLMTRPRAAIDSLAIALGLNIIWLAFAILGAALLRMAMRGNDMDAALTMLMLGICAITTGLLAIGYLLSLFG